MKIPTLKFTVKPDCEALNNGRTVSDAVPGLTVGFDRERRNTLGTLKSTSRFGVKIVKISEVRPGRTKGKKDDFPDRESRLEHGLLAVK